MLCHICSNLDIDKILPRKRVRTGCHDFHPNFSSLEASAATGCQFCSLVLDTFTGAVNGEKLEKLSKEKVSLGMTPMATRSRLVPYQGPSELWAWIGDPIARDPWVEERAKIRFALCAPRTEEEFNTGQW
jgi:hypothetical protein